MEYEWLHSDLLQENLWALCSQQMGHICSAQLQGHERPTPCYCEAMVSISSVEAVELTAKIWNIKIQRPNSICMMPKWQQHVVVARSFLPLHGVIKKKLCHCCVQISMCSVFAFVTAALLLHRYCSSFVPCVWNHTLSCSIPTAM